MARNAYVRSIDLSGSWAALSDKPLVVDTTLIAAATNALEAQLKVNEIASTWPPGTTARLEGVDLSKMFVMGNAGDQFLVVASTRELGG